MKRIAIFASGAGSNAYQLLKHLENNQQLAVSAIVSNKADAGVLKHAEQFGVPAHILSREEFYQTELLLHHLSERAIDFLVLAGFLWLIPDYLLDAFPGRIINLHPSLLPAYGGKGMYGRRVHEAVLQAGEKESGITIHEVNARYDEGRVLLQARCKVLPDDRPEVLASRVQSLEHAFFPVTVAHWIANWIPDSSNSNP